MTTELAEVIVTAGDADWLAELTRRLVEDRLAACGQIIPAVRSRRNNSRGSCRASPAPSITPSYQGSRSARRFALATR